MKMFRNVVISALFLVVLLAGAMTVSTVSAQEALPAPTGLSAVAGDSSGVVDLSWAPVTDAQYYRIGWVAYEDYLEVTGAGREWLEAFTFVDVANNGQSSHQVSRLTPGIFYYFIAGSNSSRSGDPSWSEWEGIQVPDDSQDDSSPVDHLEEGATVLVIPPPPHSNCYVGLELSPGQRCNWPHPTKEDTVKAVMAVVNEGDYHGRVANLWDYGSIWVSPAGRDNLNYSTGGDSGSATRYRFKAERKAGDVWAVTAVNETYERTCE